MGGFCDGGQYLCFSLALWNGKDPILKERLFGLNNSEGNHGEDVKELYYYLDTTPSHSYLKMLYKYPQSEYPYSRLTEANRNRSVEEAEFELLDTGLFDEDRYFDVFIEYAKAAPDDVLILITVHNRGPDSALLSLLPQIYFRNIWSWDKKAAKPNLAADKGHIKIAHEDLGYFQLDYDGEPALLFCDNDTNLRRLFGAPKAPGFFKDAFHEFIVQRHREAVNPEQHGTKAGVHYEMNILAGGALSCRLRLAQTDSESIGKPWSDFDAIFNRRLAEADEYYNDLQQTIDEADKKLVQRQAFAGLIWSKQYYHYDVRQWLEGDPAQPSPPAERKHGRNSDWKHVNNAEIFSMPDKWEYPWFAAWDLAFHCVALAEVDSEFAKSQLILLAREWFMHPNGQLPAYEWALGDVNPPVHAWAEFRVFQIDRRQRRETNPQDEGDLNFLERIFQKLLLILPGGSIEKIIKATIYFKVVF